MNDILEQEIASEEEVSINESAGALAPKEKKSRGKAVGITIFILIIGILTASFIFLSLNEEKGYAGNLKLNSKPGGNVYTDGDGRYTIQGIAKAVSSSVVGVTATGGKLEGGVSQGSGIIISEDGYIVTNAHVIEGTSIQEIWLSDERHFPARVVGSDPKTDLAVLKITAFGLVPAELGNAEELELGEAVAVLGSPIGLDGTITDGIVSGLNRKVKSDSASYRMNCIQTNAAMNPGNSGGALVNMYGQVVGVVSSKYVSLDYEGIGFAISINEALPIVENLIQNGYVTGRVRIGITYRQITTPMAEMVGDEIIPGLYIVEIDPGCDIASTELMPGDIITELDGLKAADIQNVVEMLKGRKAGEEMTAKVIRPDENGKEADSFTITFRLMEDIPEGMEIK